jgi:ubiquinone/menaquinone biosynthesis C-methylase UbiE
VKIETVDYGLDAPGVVIGTLVAAGSITVLGEIVGALHRFSWIGGVLAAVGAAMYWSSRRGKLLVRNRLLDRLDIDDDEQVLDVGCGRGLLLIGAAKRLSTGKAFGLDLWSNVDQLDNRRDATLANAAAEGVADRVEVVDGDMRQMPFEAATFDLVLSNLAIHNVSTETGRRQSIAEIARVLRPGGRVAIVDLAFTKAYADWLHDAGLVNVRHEWPARWFFPPLGIVTAEKRG